ncbi:hypothetical protein CVS37_04560 [Burkholderia lata]|nr:hypothetical protein CVS37_04560 [Burkholderia lata]
MRKGSARAPAARHGELIDHSAFRRLAQEARATGQHDAGPVAEPGQPAVRGSHGQSSGLKKDCRPGCETVPFVRQAHDLLRQ